MELYGRTMTRRELEAYVCRLEQVGGLRRVVLQEGTEAGVEQIHVRTGAGLSFFVTPTKGLDISLAEFAGVPISWQSPNGDVHPAFHHEEGKHWLSTASGGLLMTCGLTQVGSPCVEQGESLGLHGRAHHLPARQVTAVGRWAADEYEMEISGVIEETSMFGHHVRMHRRIRSRLGQNRIDIRDVVENVGFQSAPHMMLYHFNFGFPFIQENTRVQFPSQRVIARDQGVATDAFDRWQKPEAGVDEQVYYHEQLTCDAGKATVVIQSPRFPSVHGRGDQPVEARLTWSICSLPRLIQWKVPSAGMYVLGIEPANCCVEGRTAEQTNGTLVHLLPGEAVTYDLALEVRAV